MPNQSSLLHISRQRPFVKVPGPGVEDFLEVTHPVAPQVAGSGAAMPLAFVMGAVLPQGLSSGWPSQLTESIEDAALGGGGVRPRQKPISTARPPCQTIRLPTWASTFAGAPPALVSRQERAEGHVEKEHWAAIEHRACM